MYFQEAPVGVSGLGRLDGTAAVMVRDVDFAEEGIGVGDRRDVLKS